MQRDGSNPKNCKYEPDQILCSNTRHLNGSSQQWSSSNEDTPSEYTGPIENPKLLAREA